jgi:dipeptide/tripeptide permease
MKNPMYMVGCFAALSMTVALFGGLFWDRVLAARTQVALSQPVVAARH